MRAAVILVVLLGGCSSASLGGSASLGTGTKINVGATLDGSGVRPRGTISQRIF